VILRHSEELGPELPLPWEVLDNDSDPRRPAKQTLPVHPPLLLCWGHRRAETIGARPGRESDARAAFDDGYARAYGLGAEAHASLLEEDADALAAVDPADRLREERRNRDDRHLC
jgi:hypothetical protein